MHDGLDGRIAMILGRVVIPSIGSREPAPDRAPTDLRRAPGAVSMRGTDVVSAKPDNGASG